MRERRYRRRTACMMASGIVAASLIGCGSTETGTAGDTLGELLEVQSMEDIVEEVPGSFKEESDVEAVDGWKKETRQEAETNDGQQTAEKVEEPMPEGYFSNEELADIKIADPFVLKTEEGDYYLYGTTGSNGFSCMRSDDLVHWTERKVCYIKSSDSWSKSSFWAPEVFYYQDKYYMFYTAKNESGSLRIGLAVSEHPAGWFYDVGDGPLFDFGYAAIDANVLFDDDGKKYLYFSRDCSENRIGEKRVSEIYGVELTDDLTGVVGEPVKLLTPEQDWEMVSGNPLWNEGPEAIKHDGKYYLSYSANYYASSSYSVGYAVSDSPLGPFLKAEENPILTAEGRDDVSGTGHHSFTLSPDGTELWVAYHSHRIIEEPTKGRRLNMDRAGFTEDGKLYIEGPTTAPQPMPSDVTPVAQLNDERG